MRQLIEGRPLPIGVTKDDLIREICARAEDFAEGWIYGRRSGLEREMLVSAAVDFVEEALCNFGSKEASRLAQAFNTVLVHVMLTANRNKANRDRIAPMTPLDEAVEEIDARSVGCDLEENMQQLIDLRRALKIVSASEPRIHDILKARLQGESNKSIGKRFGIGESGVRDRLARALEILESVKELRERIGNGRKRSGGEK